MFICKSHLINQIINVVLVNPVSGASMLKFLIGSLVLLAVQMLMNDFAYAGETGTRNSVVLRAWTSESPVTQMLKESGVLRTFTQSLVASLLQDDQFKNLTSINFQSIQEGDSKDSMVVRFTAVDTSWSHVGPIVFDAEVRSLNSGVILSATITTWMAKSVSQRAFSDNSPRYDVPRAIIIN